MRPEETFLGQPVRSLQQMLRVLAEHDNRYLTVIPDGIYGPSTMRSVSTFQRNHGLPVTGVTDQITWETIVAAYEPAAVNIDHAQPLEIILNPSQVLHRGESSPYLFIVQAILIVLSREYASIPEPPVTGILDTATAESLSGFQSLSGLPMTGELDKVTWKHLAHHFPLAANSDGAYRQELLSQN